VREFIRSGVTSPRTAKTAPIPRRPRSRPATCRRNPAWSRWPSPEIKPLLAARTTRPRPRRLVIRWTLRPAATRPARDGSANAPVASPDPPRSNPW